jgi:hypothetical protein
MGDNINELPAELKRKIGKRAGIQREQVLKVAASIMKACTESGEALAVSAEGIGTCVEVAQG